MKLSPSVPRNQLGFALALFSILCLASARGQILLQASSDPMTVYVPLSGSQTYDIMGNITYDVFEKYDGDFGTSIQVGGYSYISGYTGFFGDIPVYTYVPIYDTYYTYEYNGSALSGVSVTNAFDANGDELAVSYAGPNVTGLNGSGTTGLVDLGQFTINSNTPLGTYEFSGLNETGNSEITLNGYTYFSESGYYSDYDQTGLTSNSALFSIVVSPEPSTYALMLGGLVLLGFCVRRKTAWLS
jgi:hypothetical protein